MKKLSIYEKWYGETVLGLEKAMECSTSDAQGFIDANDFYRQNAWIKDLDPSQAAKYLINKTK